MAITKVNGVNQHSINKYSGTNNEVITKQVEKVAAGPQLSEEMLLKMQNVGELSWEEVNELFHDLQG